MAKPRRDNRGQKKREPKEYEEEVIQLDRVTRVVKGGRRLRFRATVAIGNKKGKVGVGVAKSNEVVTAIKKAVTKAKQNLIVVPIHNDTIPHRTQEKFKASKILLIPAGPGTGIIAGGATRKIIELSGIKNILSKTLGSSNRLNNSKATIQALKALRERPNNKKKAEAKVEESKVKTETKPQAKLETKTETKPEAKKTEEKAK
jgi:small subunit ribosomal protein S5